MRRSFEWSWREEEKSIEAGRQCFSAKGQRSPLTLGPVQMLQNSKNFTRFPVTSNL
jgi:hypothetical protein